MYDNDKDNNKFQLYEEAGSDSARTVHCDRAVIKGVHFYWDVKLLMWKKCGNG